MNLMTRRSGAVLVVLAGLGMVAGLGWLNSPPAGAPGGLVTIPPGLSARAIAGELKKSGHVRSRRWWELLARAARADQRLKAGTYRVAPGAPAHRLLRDLIVGRGAMTRFVIPEGFSVRQMGERAEAVALCAAAEFRSAAESWEGFLFPETYFLDPRSGAPTIVARTGGLAEILEGTDAGMLVEPGNHHELADCIADVVANPAAADLMRANAAALLRNTYTWDAIATETVGVYRAALDD